ncbi:proline-rich protein 5-like isoform X1 [Denticeps clupeoides]|uniref:Proline-rich protein 5 n=2 Tax=Denticeps clupeoides TaxID=299321 RepID=A0AAY4DCQ5_9TELE|nr:proline-rich protein 5 isoform X1 [Denticeps clupeoides]XP_028810568.1 proline-rich protein 5 isoform X1 [Denticeps clupeoides]
MEGDRRPFRRLKLMSSPSLSELGKSEKAALEERGTQQRRAGANAIWNSIHNAVIAVFQRKDLAENELYLLNEGVRQLLKTELGSFFTEYLQNQLLTKGMVILRDKIRFYEGQKLLDSLAETWDFFFCDVLSMLQAIFYPVQGKEPSVRQLALLHFRNIITLNIKLEDALSRPRARIPPSIIQMLLILQGVHESKGVTEDYLKLESLIQKVVSPYLGTHGLFSSDGSIMQCSCVLEKRLLRRLPKLNDTSAKNPVVRSKSYNTPLLTPVVEYDSDTSSVGSMGIRRHSICEMTLCLEEPSFSEMGPGSPATDSSLSTDPQPLDLSGEEHLTEGHSSPPSPSMFPELSPHSPGPFHSSGGGQDSPSGSSQLDRHTPSSLASCSSSPETIVDQILESMDSDADGIFIDFPCRCSDSSSLQSVA